MNYSQEKNDSLLNSSLQEIKDLDRYDLQISEEVKLYHIKLCRIFIRYFGRKQNKNMRNKTTGDLLLEMTNDNFGQQNISTLATALRCGDAVKFAKYLPSSSVSEDCKSKIKETIDLLEQQTFRSIFRTNFKS